ncbi:MAG: hypothetical protein LBV72_19935 [Tannerella sp.]|jgi:hypothetical protein|nr:hypothetical protein [Tannerella sp.]
MKAILKWTKDLQNPIYRGLYPAIDPYDPLHCYIGDGWGSTFPSMKLRRISLETGGETASFRIKNTPRCIYIDKDKIFAASDNKFFILNRETLTLKKKIEKNILQYADYMEFDGKDHILLMNHRGNYLVILNYLQEKSKKKKIARSCRGIYKQSPGKFWIMDSYSGEIICYDLEKNTHQILLKDKTFTQSEIVDFETAYLRGGDIVERQNIAYVELNSKFRIISLQTKECIDEFEIPFEFEKFNLSSDKENLFLSGRNKFTVFSLKQKNITGQYIFEEQEEIISFIHGKSDTLFTYNHNANKLSCFVLTT